MPDLRLPDPWDDIIHLLQRLNLDHLDALEPDPASAIEALAKRKPDKAAWLLCEVMRAQSRLPELQRQLSAYPRVVTRADKFARLEGAPPVSNIGCNLVDKEKSF